MLRTLARAAVEFLQGESGPTAVEYAVMLALIVVVCIGSITPLGQNANTTFNNVEMDGGSGSGDTTTNHAGPDPQTDPCTGPRRLTSRTGPRHTAPPRP